MKNNNIEQRKLIGIMVSFMKKITMLNLDFSDEHEYNKNIGTIYKGSNKESNNLLRFKERFRWKHQFAFSYVLESMGR